MYITPIVIHESAILKIGLKNIKRSPPIKGTQFGIIVSINGK